MNQVERFSAIESAAEVVRHHMKRVNESLGDADELMRQVASPDAVLAEITRAANIAGRAQQAAQMWKGLVLDWRLHEPKSEAGTVAQSAS